MTNFRTIRETLGEESPFPMTFTVEECGEGFHVTPKDAQGIEGPPIHGRLVSECMMRMTSALIVAEELANKILEEVDKAISNEAADQASKN